MKYNWLKIGTLNFNMDFNKEFFPMAGGGNPRTDPPDRGDDGNCLAGVCSNLVCSNGVTRCDNNVKDQCYEVCCKPNTANGTVVPCKGPGPVDPCIQGLKEDD